MLFIEKNANDLQKKAHIAPFIHKLVTQSPQYKRKNIFGQFKFYEKHEIGMRNFIVTIEASEFLLDEGLPDILSKDKGLPDILLKYELPDEDLEIIIKRFNEDFEK